MPALNVAAAKGDGANRERRTPRDRELMLQSVSADRELIELFRKYEAVAVDTVSGIEAAYVGKAVSELGARRRNMERPANPPGFNNRFKHKTQLCRYWKAGNCSQGARCR